MNKNRRRYIIKKRRKKTNFIFFFRELHTGLCRERRYFCCCCCCCYIIIFEKGSSQQQQPLAVLIGTEWVCVIQLKQDKQMGFHIPLSIVRAGQSSAIARTHTDTKKKKKQGGRREMKTTAPWPATIARSTFPISKRLGFIFGFSPFLLPQRSNKLPL